MNHTFTYTSEFCIHVNMYVHERNLISMFLHIYRNCETALINCLIVLIIFYCGIVVFICVCSIIIIIIKRISRAPIYHTKWQHRALYNNTNHTHAHTHTYTHTRTHAHTYTLPHAYRPTHTYAYPLIRTRAHTTHEIQILHMQRERERERERELELENFTRIVVYVQSKTCLTTSPC